MFTDGLLGYADRPTLRIYPRMNHPFRLSAGLFFALLAASAVDCRLAHAQPAGLDPLDRVVAVVDEDVILQSELDRSVDAILAQSQASGSPPPRLLVERQVLDRLILTRIQVERASSTGIRVSDGEVDASVDRVAAQNQLSLEQLRASLEQDGFSLEEFRRTMRDEITVQRFRQRFAQSRVQITDSEIDILLASDSLKSGEVRLSHILIGLSDGASPEEVEKARAKSEQVVAEIRDGLSFAQAAIKYSSGQQALEGGDLGWRRYEEVPTAFADLVAGMKTGDVAQPLRGPNGFHILKLVDQRADTGPKMVTEYHARHILIQPNELQSDSQCRERITKLREIASEGADFGELAKINSEDISTANLGGDLGWFSPGQFGQVVDKVVAGLKDGEISEPFRTDLGWHIMKREGERQTDRSEQFVRDQAREAIFRRKAEEEYDNFLRQMRAEAYVENHLPKS